MMTPMAKWARFNVRHGIRTREIPARGFCLSVTGGRVFYEACFLSKAHARRGAQLLANAEHRRVDLVQVQGRGDDRFIIAQIEPARRR